MDLKLYNTLTRQLEIFTPLEPTVRLYTCGPTVYNYAHIGNWRSFLMGDLLRRTLEYNQFPVKYVMNITDVDDKTISGSQKANQSLTEFTQFYEQAFLADLKALHILPPTIFTHATAFIPQMIDLISKLIETNHAYATSDGIYFAVDSFPEYGKLSQRPVDGSEARDDQSHDKKDPRDFAVWKFKSATDGEVGWDAPFGAGRPGWHIECSAMSMSELGNQFDLHTGGADLMFPHHDNEIAQSEAATGASPLARFWLHGAFLNINDEKMSKSLDNFYTLRDIEIKQISPLAYRLWVLTAHYRTPANFSWEALAGAQTALNKIYTLVRALGSTLGEVDQNFRERFLAALNNDLNAPQALALLWELLDSPLSPPVKLATILDFDKVLGLGLADLKPIEIPPAVTELAANREAARQAQNWALADELRAKIASLGFQVNDSPSGPQITQL